MHVVAFGDLKVIGGFTTPYNVTADELVRAGLNQALTLSVIAKESISIIKLGLNEVVPCGYNELPRGYIRGFYVQYTLDNFSLRKMIRNNRISSS